MCFMCIVFTNYLKCPPKMITFARFKVKYFVFEIEIRSSCYLMSVAEWRTTVIEVLSYYKCNWEKQDALEYLRNVLQCNTSASKGFPVHTIYFGQSKCIHIFIITNRATTDQLLYIVIQSVTVLRFATTHINIFHGNGHVRQKPWGKLQRPMFSQFET